jgi:hypothetical protein
VSKKTNFQGPAAITNKISHGKSKSEDWQGVPWENRSRHGVQGYSQPGHRRKGSGKPGTISMENGVLPDGSP